MEFYQIYASHFSNFRALNAYGDLPNLRLTSLQLPH
jgi:hypothetical protein